MGLDEAILEGTATEGTIDRLHDLVAAHRMAFLDTPARTFEGVLAKGLVLTDYINGDGGSLIEDYRALRGATLNTEEARCAFAVMQELGAMLTERGITLEALAALPDGEVEPGRQGPIIVRSPPAPHPRTGLRQTDERFLHAPRDLAEAERADERAEADHNAIDDEIMAGGVPAALLCRREDDQLVPAGLCFSVIGHEDFTPWYGHVAAIAGLRRAQQNPRVVEILAAFDGWAQRDRMVAWSATFDAMQAADRARSTQGRRVLEVRVSSLDHILTKLSLATDDEVDPLVRLTDVDHHIHTAFMKGEAPKLEDLVLRDLMGMLMARDASLATLTDGVVRGRHDQTADVGGNRCAA